MRLLLVTAALFSAGAEFAEPAATAAPPAGPEALAKLKAADADKDGKWTKAEWLAAGRREMGFGFIDADKDGFVTEDELKTGVAKARAMGLTP